MHRAPPVAPPPPLPPHPQCELGAFLELCVCHADPSTTVFTRPLPPLAVTGYAMLTRFRIDDFEMQCVIAKGNTGKTFKVTHKPSKTDYALKCVNNCDQELLRDVEKVERSVLLSGRQLPRSSTIVATHDVIVSSFSFQSSSSALSSTRDEGAAPRDQQDPQKEQQAKKVYIVRDYKAGGEIFHWLSYLATFSLETVRFFSAQIGIAIDLLEPFIRGEIITPERLLLDRDGYCSVIPPLFNENEKEDRRRFVRPADESNYIHGFIGTPEYIAPEVLMGNPKTSNTASAWWSLGCIMYEMVCGLPPFYDEDIQTMYDAIFKRELSFPDSLSDAIELHDLIRQLLDRDPKKRMCRFQSFKTHSFFRGFDWSALEERRMPCPEEIRSKMDSDGMSNFANFSGLSSRV